MTERQKVSKTERQRAEIKDRKTERKYREIERQ